MTSDILSKYSQSPYIIIGLDLENKLSDRLNSIVIQQIFINVKDCEEFIVKQTNNEKIVLIVSGHLSSDELKKLKKYSKINAIYLFSESNNFNEQFKCIYTKTICRKYLEVLVRLLKKFWFLLGLGIAIGFAAIYPSLGASGGILHGEYTFKWGCVIIIFLLSGLSLPTKTLTTEFLHFRLHILIQVFSFILIPFTVYGICLLLVQSSFNRILIAGIITMACTSTTISSNVIMTKNAGGNESAALVNAVLGNILGIVISPALICLFMLNPAVNVLNQPYNTQDYLQALINLSLTVLVPLIVGQIIHYIWTEKVMWAKTKFHFTAINSTTLLILIWSIFCDLFQSRLLETVKQVDLVVVAVINASLYITFSLLAMFVARLPNIFICRKRTTNHDQQLLLDGHQKKKTLIERWRFSRKDTIAIMFCSAAKTVAKGIPLINAVNSANNQNLIGLFSLPLILYHVEQLILGSIEVFLLQKWLKSKEDTNYTEPVDK